MLSVSEIFDPEGPFDLSVMMIVIKLCFLLSLVALVKGNSVERCPACPRCDIDLEWSPVPNMALCMYGYDPFEMDRFTKGKPDPGVKKRIFEPTKYSTERNAMILNDFVDKIINTNTLFSDWVFNHVNPSYIL